MKRSLCLLCALFVSISWAAPKPAGFLFEKNDHFLTPSEKLSFVYEISPGDEKILEQGIHFVIRQNGISVASGNGQSNFEYRDSLAIISPLKKEFQKTLKNGWHDFAVRLLADGKEKEFFNQKFFVNNGPFSHRVVYLLDNVTPEGFAFWCNEPDETLIEPLRDFPAEGKPDCVVVSSFTALSEEQFTALKKYIAEGGTALFFGVNHTQLDELNPLKLDRANLYPAAPKQGLYLLNAKLADGAKQLRDADSALLMAEKPYGKGKVVAVTAGIKPGDLYRDMLSRGLGVKIERIARPEVVSTLADAEGFREGISRNNFGRFGYLTSDRTNALSLRPEQTFRMWDVEQDYFGVSFSGKHEPGIFSTLETNWLGKRLLGQGGRWKDGTEIVWGLGTPGVLFRNQQEKSVSFESPMLGTLAFPVKNGTRSIALKEGKIDLAGLSSNWLLVWKRTDRYDAWPLLISFASRISSAEMKDGRLILNFDKRGIDLSVMPLAGLKHYTPEETATWENGLPAELAARCVRWNRILAARTVGCIERYKFDAEKKSVTIRNEFDYLVIPNQWGVEPEYVSFLPPLLPLYAKTGFVSLNGSAVDLDFGTFHGPLWGVPGKRSEYVLTIPDLEYPLPVKAADPRLESAANKALFERITEHLAVPGLVYIAPDYGIVERQKNFIYPERELKEATAKSGPEAAEWKYIDLHRTLGGVTGNLMFKPYLDGVKGYNETRDRMNTKITRNIRRDINFFQYKTFLRYRQEPNTGAKYLMAFISPVRYNDGYWMFHDMNETAGIFAQTLALYSRVVGDRPFFEANELFIDAFMSNYFVSQDWAWMASCAVEWGMGNNIDMLNAELSGWAGMVQVKSYLGKEGEADFARYMAARAGAATGARLLIKDFYNSLNFPIPPQLAPVIHEMADVGQAQQKRNNYLPLGVSHGYGEGWPSLWPTSISAGMLKHFIDGKDFYSTSKGVPAELLNFYRSSEAMAAPLRHYEQLYRDAAYASKSPYLYSRMAGNAFLKDDRADLEQMLFRTLRMPGCTAKILGAGAADWESPGMIILLELLRRSADEDKSVNCVPVGDERNGKFIWETTDEGKVKIRTITIDEEPANVADGALAVHFDFPGLTGKPPVVFTRFDRNAVWDKKCRALSFLVKVEKPGTLDFVLPSGDWSKRMSTSLPLSGGDRKRVRLEFGRELKTNGMKPEELRGELFIYNNSAQPVAVYLDDLRFEP